MSSKLPLYESIPSFIRYTDSKSQTTNRVIIPTSTPADVVKAIDVTDLSVEERERLALLHAEYKAYVVESLKTLFTFETFVKHVYDEQLDLKWRTFTKDNITA